MQLPEHAKGTFWETHDPLVALAPMAGVTDSPFRRICKHYGAPLVWSEFVSVRGLHHNWAKSSALLEYTQEEYPVVMQIFGDEPEYMADAAEKIEQAFSPAGIDINCGCPAKKVMKTGAGVALMEHPKLVSEIINAISERISVPLSLKTRAGIRDTDVYEFAMQLPLDKLSGLTIHGRTYEEKFTGDINLELLRRVKEQAPCRVVANGGIATLDDMHRIREATGIDGFMVGAAALGRPWIFRELTNNTPHEPSPMELKETILLHATYMSEFYGEERGILNFRKHLLWYLKGFPGAKELRKRLASIRTVDALQETLELFLPAE